jgi:hypothetical protein
MNKWLKSPVWGQLEHMEPRDAMERVIASMVVLTGLLVTLLILIAIPGSGSSAFAIGLGIISVMLALRSLAIGNMSDA